MPTQEPVSPLQTLPNLSDLLPVVAVRGVFTQPQAERLTSLTPQQLRTLLDHLAQPPPPSPSLLDCRSVSIAGLRGRPARLFTLTADGAAQLKPLGLNRSAPKLGNDIEAAHALIEMDVYTLALQAGLSAKVEHPLNGQSADGFPVEIRADVFVQNEQGKPFLIEIEQAARAANLPRIVQKLTSLNGFFQAPCGQTVQRDVRLLFAISAGDRQTLAAWQRAWDAFCAENPAPAFRLLWMLLPAFLENPTWEADETFHPLKASKASPPGQVSLSLAPDPSAWLTALPAGPAHALQETGPVVQALFGLYADELQKLETQRAPNGQAFFELVCTIYLASHYPDGPVQRLGAWPVASFWLLRQYLHLSQNGGLLKSLRFWLKAARNARMSGLSLLRDALTRLAWDGFLAYHGFGRGGALLVSVQPPDEDCTELHTGVSIRSAERLLGPDWSPQEICTAEKALAWVLDTLWTYAFDLDLIVNESRRPRKGGKR